MLGHLLRANVFLFALQPGFARQGRAQPRRRRGLAGAATPRERLHLAAARAWAAGELTAAGAAFDAILAAHPRDLMALMFAHQADFFSGGDARRWKRARRGRSRPGALSCPATATSRRCSRSGSRRPGPTPRPRPWVGKRSGATRRTSGASTPSVTCWRCRGATRRASPGTSEREADWAPGCYFAVHNAWHLALYHVDREDPAAALAVYDRLLRPGPPQHPAQSVRRRGAAVAAAPDRRGGRRALGRAGRPDDAAHAGPGARVRRRAPGDRLGRRRALLRAGRAAALAGGAGRGRRRAGGDGAAGRPAGGAGDGRLRPWRLRAPRWRELLSACDRTRA